MGCQLEVGALKKHVDFLVEGRSRISHDYEFNTSTKDVQSGRIIASVTSLGRRPPYQFRNLVVATPTGYKIVEFPSVEDAALDLMEALTTTWEAK